ncbi:MAG: hypothetical protein JWM68_1403 [Verrucomicrobiales bacterium]|nr:hypothetical protein [Verrucomicrobiales bacterium]
MKKGFEIERRIPFQIAPSAVILARNSVDFSTGVSGDGELPITLPEEILPFPIFHSAKLVKISKFLSLVGLHLLEKIPLISGIFSTELKGKNFFAGTFAHSRKLLFFWRNILHSVQNFYSFSGSFCTQCKFYIFLAECF